MLIVLKIPIVYLCLVVWWAIRAEPSESDPAVPVAVGDTPSPAPRSWSRRVRGVVPRPGPPRRPAPARPAILRAGARR